MARNGLSRKPQPWKWRNTVLEVKEQWLERNVEG